MRGRTAGWWSADEPVRKKCQGGGRGGCCWLGGLLAFVSMVTGATALEGARGRKEQRQRRQQATAGGAKMDSEDGGIEIGTGYRDKPISGLAAGARQNCPGQTEQIPAGGRAAGAWGLMDVLGSWPVVSSPDPNGLQLEVCANTHTQCMTPGVSDLVRAVGAAAESGKDPKQSIEGLGGTYFIQNEEGKEVAIFKPCDEEPMAPNNPKGFVGRSLGAPGLKPTVRVGEAAIREVAAYLLDKGFANVPHTLLVRASHSCFHYAPVAPEAAGEGSDLAFSASPETDESVGNDRPHLKIGSLQEFVPHMCDTSEMGTSRFNVGDVHRIGILDVRLYNTDRHAGNMLVRKPAAGRVARSGAARLQESQYELIPIDHGFCLPEALEPPYFEWLYWPQAMLPFTEDELQYIADLDFEADKKLLEAALPILPVECLRTLEVTTVLLQRCAAAGLSLHEIGEVMSRPLVVLDNEQSKLERLCQQVKQEVMACVWDRSLGPSPSDSDGEGSNYSRSPRKEEELQFCIDDVHGEILAQDFEDPPAHQHVHANNSPLGGRPGSKQTPVDVKNLEVPFENLSINPAEPAAEKPTRCPVGRAIACHKASRSVSLQLPSAHQHRDVGGQGRLRQRKLSMQMSGPVVCDLPAYPPPVEGAAPYSANDIFSNMEEEEWDLFMALLTSGIQDALDNGLWKIQDRIPAPSLGMSCPKF